ncbi:hypothetical protein [Caproiciproducens sp. LBM24188]
MKTRQVVAIILWILSALILIGSVNQQYRLSAMPAVTAFTLIGLLLFFIKGKSKEEKVKSQSVKLSTITVKHFAGLPLPEGVRCVIQRNPNGFVFISGGNTFNLSNDKITDICIKTDTEIQKQYVSSIGGAVGGAVLFGPIGAMIGGRAKQKKTTTITRYLIFTYLKDSQVAYIGFEIQNPIKVQRWINEFRQSSHASGISVTL